MVEIIVRFIEQKDAYDARANLIEDFRGTKLLDDIIVIDPVRVSKEKDLTRTGAPVYEFKCYIHTGSDDTEIEKTISINGGQLSVMNGKKHIWAFS